MLCVIWFLKDGEFEEGMAWFEFNELSVGSESSKRCIAILSRVCNVSVVLKHKKK